MRAQFRAVLFLTAAAIALTAVSAQSPAKTAAGAPAPSGAPLAAPLGVTYGSIKPALPPGVTQEQVAMAAAAGMTIFKNIDVYATTTGMTLYTYDPNVKLSIMSDIGALVDNPGTKAVLEKHIPGISTNPALAQARGLNFDAVKRFLPILTEEKLNAMAADLEKAPSEPAKASCVDECAKAWPPFLAPAGAQAGGLWTIVARPDGAKQWAYNGKVVHTFTKDEKAGDAKGNKADGGKWMQAVVKAVADMPMPNGFKVTETMAVDGKVLVDPAGMTLYTFDADKPNMSACEGGCTQTWHPLDAPRVAAPIGDFSVVTRADGTKQWAFKGKALYTYAGDAVTGDAKGDNLGGKWHQVMLARYYFPEGVAVLNHPKHGPMLAAGNGATLYARDAHRFTLAGGSHDDRSALRGNVPTGTKIGVTGCVEDCLKDFKPFHPTAGAMPWGDWTIVDRPDGSKQWAYRGYPLYTYGGDKQPGDTVAHDMYQLTDGTTGLFWRVALP